jgi:hypothetical protein
VQSLQRVASYHLDEVITMTALALPTVTGYSPFWANVLTTGNGDSATTYAFPSVDQNGARPPMDSQLARILKRNTYRAMNEVFLTLIGTAAGSTAEATHKVVSAPTGPEQTVPAVTSIGDFGGNREIETITDINRATVTADETWISKFFNNKLLEAGITYPTVSGSGGGGKITAGVNRF